MITRYQKRISGPLLDRIDIPIEVPRVEDEKLSDDRLGEKSSVVRARQIQRERFAGSDLHYNVGMHPAEIRNTVGWMKLEKL